MHIPSQPKIFGVRMTMALADLTLRENAVLSHQKSRIYEGVGAAKVTYAVLRII
jgi:hypothetical protein